MALLFLPLVHLKSGNILPPSAALRDRSRGDDNYPEKGAEILMQGLLRSGIRYLYRNLDRLGFFTELNSKEQTNQTSQPPNPTLQSADRLNLFRTPFFRQHFFPIFFE